MKGKGSKEGSQTCYIKDIFSLASVIKTTTDLT